MPGRRRYAIVFVCQQGKLEAQAAVLAASLRRFCRLDCELIAAIPGPAQQWGEPGKLTLAFLSKLGVRTVGVTNQIDPTYNIGNKIGCLSIPTDADKLILLDTDMMLMRPWEDQARFAIPFNARPAAVPLFGNDSKIWDTVYAACGASQLPGLVVTSYSNQLIAPYFNSAFVAVPAKSGFGEVWLDCCRKIDKVDSVPNKRPFLDQIALPPTVAKLGLEYDCLDETYSHPSKFKVLEEDRLPLLFHYHDTGSLACEPLGVAMLRSLIDEHPELAEILRLDPQWQVFLTPIGAALAQSGLDLLITGIPRSGTSYLCNLLHRYDNCVVLNEPDEIPPAIAAEGPLLPWSVARFYRWQRCEINLGHSIRNKLIDGKVTQDTARAGETALYHPQVSPDCVLGTKATGPFLNRLQQLRRVMPAARIVACVRNPFDTIASWKTSFDHLKNADVLSRPVGNPGDPWLSPARRMELEQIAAIPSPAWRRAAWWRYQAQMLLESIDSVLLVRYQELVSDPQPILSEILKGGRAGKLTEPIAPSQERRKIEALDAEDVRAIRSFCSETASALGVYRAAP